MLDPEDDAATVNWGGAWRMPTYDELNELKIECTWVWTIQNGVNGYKVIGANSSFIFLPAAGLMAGSSLYELGLDAHYWSSSLTSSSFYAHDVWFTSDNVCWNLSGGRASGFSVRPVCE